MGYERNDGRYGGSSGGYGRFYGENRDRGNGGFGSDDGRGNRYGSERDYRGERFDRDDGRGDQRRRWHGYDDDRDRGFFERAGDEVRSWFGDDDAERRRREDERRGGYDRDRNASSYGGGWAGEYGAVDPYAYAGPTAFGGDGGYGADRSRGPGSDQGRRRDHLAHHDQGYRSWRDRQMEAFDRDYDEYRREHQSKFDSDFAAWRQSRQGQRDLLGKVQEHQDVVGSDGEHVGTVDHVRGDRIRLTKSDQQAGGQHHSIPSSWIQSVEDKITLSKTAAQARQHWRDEARNEGESFAGGHKLDRSFSGTY